MFSCIQDAIVRWCLTFEQHGVYGVCEILRKFVVVIGNIPAQMQRYFSCVFSIKFYLISTLAMLYGKSFREEKTRKFSTNRKVRRKKHDCSRKKRQRSFVCSNMDWIVQILFVALSQNILYDLIGRVFIRCLSEQKRWRRISCFISRKNLCMNRKRKIDNMNKLFDYWKLCSPCSLNPGDTIFSYVLASCCTPNTHIQELG